MTLAWSDVFNPQGQWVQPDSVSLDLAQSACTAADIEMFFGTVDDNGRAWHTTGQIQEARTICAACPVVVECLATEMASMFEHARNSEHVRLAVSVCWSFGVRGGTTRNQREKLGTDQKVNPGLCGGCGAIMFGDHKRAHCAGSETKPVTGTATKGIT